MNRSEYSREQPSPRYRELLDLYAGMHTEIGERFLGIAPHEVFLGISLLPHVERIKRLIDQLGAKTVLDYGSGKGLQYGELSGPLGRLGKRTQRLVSHIGQCPSIPSYWGVEPPACYDPAYPPFSALPAGRFDGVICTDVLEHCPEEDLDWILEELWSYAKKFLYASIACQEAVKRLPNGENAHCTVRSPEWWRKRIRVAAARRPEVRYEVRLGGVLLRG